MTSPRIAQSVLAGAGDWWRAREGSDLGILTEGKDYPRFEVDENTCVVVRGTVALAGGETLDHKAARLVAAYREHGRLEFRDWQGAFTVILADTWKHKLLAYRSMVAPGFTYYLHTDRGAALSSNAALLAGAVDHGTGLNPEVLPALFLFRTVPGRDTLFSGVQRLLPGEVVELSAAGVRRERLQILGDLHSPYDQDPVDALEWAMGSAVADVHRVSPQCTTLLSGGVDSSYLHVHRLALPGGDQSPPSFSVAPSHDLGAQEKAYAQSVAEAVNHPHTVVPLREPFVAQLIRAIQQTGELPNHVQTVYFPAMARAMTQVGAGVGLCGQGADALLGLGLVYDVQDAARWNRKLGGLSNWGAELASLFRRRYLADRLRLAAALDNEARWDHPLNRVGRWTDRAAVEASFGAGSIAAALSTRRKLLAEYAGDDHLWTRIASMDLVGEVMDSASLWTTLFEANGRTLAMPYLDSRIVRFAFSTDLKQLYPPGEPKRLLKRALARHLDEHLINRPKLAFSQPVLSWLAPGGPLEPYLKALDAYPFLHAGAVAAARKQPNWFLYSLLCFDIWHKTFVHKRDLLQEHGLTQGAA